MAVKFFYFWKVRRWLSDSAERAPSLYVSIQRFRYPRSSKVLRNDSVIVIEGFPRCANSFAVRAFRYANDPEKKHRVATHMHSPAQVVRGLKLNKPVLVLIRQPDEAIVSQLALFAQLDVLPKLIKRYEMSIDEKEALVSYWTWRYCQFYQRLLPYVSDVVIGEFNEVISDFDGIISKVNRRFGASFKGFPHCQQTVQEIFSTSGVHLSPSPQRDELKRGYRDIYFSPGNSRARLEAKEVYRQVINASVESMERQSESVSIG